MNYEINDFEDYFEITVNQEYKVNVMKESIDYHDLCEYVESNIDRYKEEYKIYILEKIRKNRDFQFSKYDKYQLALVWQELTDEQKVEYASWRSSWLNATETLIEPSILSWFVD